MTDTPLVMLPACRLEKDGQSFHTVGDKYVRAVAERAGCFPVMLPSLSEFWTPDQILTQCDGIVLTGSPSNVHPEAYGAEATPRAEPYDTWRDAVTLPLIRAAVRAAVPLLAICRGMQELNVAYGGTLFPEVHAEPGRDDHRHPEGDIGTRYGPRHSVRLTAGGLLARLTGKSELTVNSLHWQGIAEPARDVMVEARAADGTVEAVGMPGAPGFVLGVQWHPEYAPGADAGSDAIFRAFGDAARARRTGTAPAAASAGR